jgi:hypothetical protein
VILLQHSVSSANNILLEMSEENLLSLRAVLSLTNKQTKVHYLSGNMWV